MIENACYTIFTSIHESEDSLMLASNIFALIWFVSVIGIFVFFISALINLIQGRPAKEDGKKILIFFVLSIVFLTIFGIIYDNETEEYRENELDNPTHHQHDSDHHRQD